ncbi:MAG: acylphosphatase [Nocardioidaceae bacterium]|nr:acylphosphatase [Nocardioidaceae bacterium]NUS52448.1 acylphosphatase [Nocardioidaceae bacterium]
MADRVARRVVVHGRVQGVFYRDTCRYEARAAGVAGWVSNEPDGTVHAHFEGRPDAVARLVAWTREGPPRASVRDVDVSEVPPEGLAGFEVR